MTLRTAVWGITFGVVLLPTALFGQTVQGRLVDSENGEPVKLAGVFVLDTDRGVVVGAASDTAGFYSVTAPDAGEFYLYVQRIGYFENETPLFRAEVDRTYSVDIEMRPEPFRIDPLDVTVRNEELEQFLTLEFGMNPNSLYGYRAYQGTTVQQAKLNAEDNTDFLRELFIPVSHGRLVCIGTFMGRGMPSRNGLQFQEEDDDQSRCGGLYIDGYSYPNEHIEDIELESIAVVVTLPGQVRLYTREFDWTMKPGGGGGP